MSDFIANKLSTTAECPLSEDYKLWWLKLSTTCKELHFTDAFLDGAKSEMKII